MVCVSFQVAINIEPIIILCELRKLLMNLGLTISFKVPYYIEVTINLLTLHLPILTEPIRFNIF